MVTSFVQKGWIVGLEQKFLALETKMLMVQSMHWIFIRKDPSLHQEVITLTFKYGISIAVVDQMVEEPK